MLLILNSQELLVAKADPTKALPSGLTPLWAARQRGNGSIVQILEDLTPPEPVSDEGDGPLTAVALFFGQVFSGAQNTPEPEAQIQPFKHAEGLSASDATEQHPEQEEYGQQQEQEQQEQVQKQDAQQEEEGTNSDVTGFWNDISKVMIDVTPSQDKEAVLEEAAAGSLGQAALAYQPEALNSTKCSTFHSRGKWKSVVTPVGNATMEESDAGLHGVPRTVEVDAGAALGGAIRVEDVDADRKMALFWCCDVESKAKVEMGEENQEKGTNSNQSGLSYGISKVMAEATHAKMEESDAGFQGVTRTVEVDAGAALGDAIRVEDADADRKMALFWCCDVESKAKVEVGEENQEKGTNSDQSGLSDGISQVMTEVILVQKDETGFKQAAAVGPEQEDIQSEAFNSTKRSTFHSRGKWGRGGQN